MSGLFAFFPPSLSCFLYFFPAVWWSRPVGPSSIARRYPFRVCRCLYTNGAQAHNLRHVGRSDLWSAAGLLDPLLRGVDEHADVKIDPAFPSPVYVGCSVQPVRQPGSRAAVPACQAGIRRWREAQAQIPMGQPGRACVPTGLRRNSEPC